MKDMRYYIVNYNGETLGEAETRENAYNDI